MLAGQLKLGLDLGGVLAESLHGYKDLLHQRRGHLRVPEVCGAFDAVNRLQQKFRNHIYVVSMVPSMEIAAKSKEWLFDHDFYARTCVRPEQVQYCLTHEAKAPLCATLGITHFVDDRIAVLRHLETVPFRLLFGARDHHAYANQKEILPPMHPVSDWKEAETLFRSL